MPWRRLFGHPGDLISYLGSGGMVAGGGKLFAQATNQAQSFWGAVGIIFGFLTFATPHIMKEMDRRREERGLARQAAEAKARADKAERTANDLAAKVAEMDASGIRPNAVHLAAIDGKLAATRAELTKQGFLKPSPSTDEMPVIRPALLVEDDPATAKFMAELMTAAGCDVTVAATLAEASEKLATTPGVRIIVLDLGLPDGDGLDVVRHARQDGLDCRFIVTTGYSSGARLDQVSSHLHPGDRLFVKPVDYHTLMTAILPKPRPRPERKPVHFEPHDTPDPDA